MASWAGGHEDATLLPAVTTRRALLKVGFGLQVVREQPGDCHYHLTRSTLLERARARGVGGELAICEAHEEFWATVARGIDAGPNVRFSPTMRDGHWCCDVRLRGLDPGASGPPRA
jgi:hypothetical protein